MNIFIIPAQIAELALRDSPAPAQYAGSWP